MTEPIFTWEWERYRFPHLKCEWAKSLSVHMVTMDKVFIAFVGDDRIGQYRSWGEAQQACEHEWMKRNGWPEGAPHGGANTIEELSHDPAQ